MDPHSVLRFVFDVKNEAEEDRFVGAILLLLIFVTIVLIGTLGWLIWSVISI